MQAAEMLAGEQDIQASRETVRKWHDWLEGRGPKLLHVRAERCVIDS